MDKLSTYRSTIKRLITDHAALANRCARNGDDHFTAFDDDRGLYALIKAGWIDGRHVRGTVLFVRLAEGKIWVEEEGTEEGIANELAAAGVPKHDIVLGFQPPRVRPLGEFAVA